MVFMFIRLIFPPGCHGLIQGSSTLKSVNSRVATQSEGLPQIKLTKKKPNDLRFHQMILAEFNEICNKKNQDSIGRNIVWQENI